MLGWICFDFLKSPGISGSVQQRREPKGSAKLNLYKRSLPPNVPIGSA